MAIHFLECAAHTSLSPSKKLALMAIADDADKESRVASAGLDAIMAWSGLKRSRALDVIAELVTEGYLHREASGRIGRRARFVVFPNGCCALHGPIRPGSAESDPEIAAVANPSRGSDRPDPSGSDGPDPQSEVEGPKEGPKEGPTATGPVPYVPMSFPPNPREAGGCRTEKPVHKHGCRACGTSTRQKADRERRGRPPKNECRMHRGQLADHCALCRSERIARPEAS